MESDMLIAQFGKLIHPLGKAPAVNLILLKFFLFLITPPALLQ